MVDSMAATQGTKSHREELASAGNEGWATSRKPRRKGLPPFWLSSPGYDTEKDASSSMNLPRSKSRSGSVDAYHAVGARQRICHLRYGNEPVRRPASRCRYDET